MASFTGYGKVQAELTNGQIIECETSLCASGDYREWYEPAPCEWMYGWTESEQDIDEDSIEAHYPDEFECETEYPAEVKIQRIIKVLEDIDWEVEDGWDEPDPDAAYDAWRDDQVA